MKRLICIFLMLWLPLFMGSASAMSMHMALENQSTDLGLLAHSVAKVQGGCHDDAEILPQTQSKSSNQKHQCFACGTCALANSSASFDTIPVFDILSQTSMTPQYFNVAFYSLGHPPVIKPPILN